MFISISNHPSTKWDTNQLCEAAKLGGDRQVCSACGTSVPSGFCPYCNGTESGPTATKWVPDIKDVQFPNVPPTASTEEVTAMAKELVVREGFAPAGEMFPPYAMVQGEFSLTYELTRMLIAMGWIVVVATSERLVEEVDGKKVVAFKFVQFRRIRR